MAPSIILFWEGRRVHPLRICFNGIIFYYFRFTSVIDPSKHCQMFIFYWAIFLKQSFCYVFLLFIITVLLATQLYLQVVKKRAFSCHMSFFVGSQYNNTLLNVFKYVFLLFCCCWWWFRLHVGERFCPCYVIATHVNHDTIPIVFGFDLLYTLSCPLHFGEVHTFLISVNSENLSFQISISNCSVFVYTLVWTRAISG